MPPLRLSLEGVRLKKLHILCKRQVTAPEAQTSCGVFSVVSLHAADGLSVYLDNSPAPSRGSLPLDFLAQAHPLHVHHATPTKSSIPTAGTLALRTDALVVKYRGGLRADGIPVAYAQG